MDNETVITQDELDGHFLRLDMDKKIKELWCSVYSRTLVEVLFNVDVDNPNDLACEWADTAVEAFKKRFNA